MNEGEARAAFLKMFGADLEAGRAQVRELIRRGIRMGGAITLLEMSEMFTGFGVEFVGTVRLTDRDFLILAFFALLGTGDETPAPKQLPGPDPLVVDVPNPVSALVQASKTDPDAFGKNADKVSKAIRDSREHIEESWVADEDGALGDISDD